GGELSGRQHFNNHPVIALVGVERAHDPVAPTPDLGGAVPHVGHMTAAIPVGITPDVHPVSRPALGILARSEQAIDDLLVCIGRSVRQKGTQLLACRWQADEVELNTAQENFLPWCWA